MKRLENKTALVTSATRGIGLACATSLAAEGARVFLGARNLELANEICRQQKENGCVMQPVYFDALKKDCYSPMIDTVIREAGQLDILVNNFGMGNPMEDLDLLHGKEEAFFSILENNLGSVYRITKLALPSMIEKGHGSIINVSSIGGIIPDLTRLGYGVSKAAINNLTKQIALQYARNNIRCNAVLPGLTATDAVMKYMSESFIQSFLSHVPMNRMGKPEDIANAVLFFAEDASSYITGHILEVAGGYGLGTPQYADQIRQQNHTTIEGS